ncbi:hypothetical protein NEHOM01_1174 [Nematocida homosporus]|uniref:uncharacterized protein n=1 Tax=Nematocida homosporus TaxID=1912981 RepID=UPI00221F5949|nr:uncharacterized protein NEHOM01_1174 [Nematocida homosporus]KAI5185951.1 hypothetical protein NEHOM01_1174 [Nematocida homosporus]
MAQVFIIKKTRGNIDMTLRSNCSCIGIKKSYLCPTHGLSLSECNRQKGCMSVFKQDNGHWLVGLCVLLVLLSRVGGFNGLDRLNIDIEVYENDNDNEDPNDWASDDSGGGQNIFDISNNQDTEVLRATPLDSSDMLKILEDIGFFFRGERPNLVVALAGFGPSNASSSFTDNHILSVVEYNGPGVSFSLPRYSSEQDAQIALEKLRTIAFITAVQADSVCVSDRNANPSCYQVNTQILTRVVNMIDCQELTINLTNSWQDQPDKQRADFLICRNEAEETIAHAIFQLPCQLQFSTTMKCSLSVFASSDIHLLRSVLVVVLTDFEFQNTSGLNQLIFTEGYTIAFTLGPGEVDIDFGFLQVVSATCNKIIIIATEQTELSLTGLENATTKHPDITLEAHWTHIQYLGIHNKSNIQVDTILNLNLELWDYYNILNVPKDQTIPPHRVYANKATVTISCELPCNLRSYYQKLYTTYWASNGVMIDDFQISFKETRNDVQKTLFNLYQFSGTQIQPQNTEGKEVICCGESLSDPNWTIHESIKIQLDRVIPILYPNDCHPSDYIPVFCQNIHYTTIEITGSSTPCYQQVPACIKLLDLFRGINAQELKIKQVCFGLPHLDFYLSNTDRATFPIQLNSANAVKFKTLILDHVDNQIIYWMLSNYVFVNPVEVHILNQQFNNLAIVKILSLPTTRQIATLAINDFLKLDEVSYYPDTSPFRSNGFSLSRYVEDELKARKTLEHLGLHKLLIQLGWRDYSRHSDVLLMLLRYGIQLQAIPFATYTMHTAIHPVQPNIPAKKEFMLYNIPLESLKDDCVHPILTQPPLQPDSNQEASIQKQSVDKLLLRFQDNSSLTEPDLAIILQWISSRFKDLITLQLINIRVAASVRIVLESRNFWVTSQPMLTSIQIDSFCSGKPNIKIPIQPYSRGLLANNPNTLPKFTAVSLALAARFLAQPDQTTNPRLTTSTTPNPPIQKIINHIKNSTPHIKCPECHRVLCVLDEREAEQDLVSSTRPSPQFTTLCYPKSGPPICNICVISLLASHKPPNSTNSPQPGLDDDPIYQLIGIPLDNFVFISTTSPPTNINTTATPTPNLERLSLLADSCDQHIYFYLPYQNPSDALINPNYNPTLTHVHII